MPEDASKQAPHVESIRNCVLSLRLNTCASDSGEHLPAASECNSPVSLLLKPRVIVQDKFFHRAREGVALASQQVAELFLHLSTLYKDI